MSDRRPEKPYFNGEFMVVHDPDPDDGHNWMSKASPADLLAAVRRGVESGTIKGEVVSPHIAEGDGPYTPNLHLDPGTYLVIPVSDGGSET